MTRRWWMPAAGWARTENAACARKTAVMAEMFARRTGLPDACLKPQVLLPLSPPAENVLVPGGRLARAATARRSEVFGHAHL
jgi:hypothetical protein